MKKAVQNDSCGPNIDPSVDFVVLCINKALGSHIPKTSCVQIFMGHEVNRSCYTEIDNLDFLFLRVD